jgi:hypothetical protein
MREQSGEIFLRWTVCQEGIPVSPDSLHRPGYGGKTSGIGFFAGFRTLRSYNIAKRIGRKAITTMLSEAWLVC